MQIIKKLKQNVKYKIITKQTAGTGVESMKNKKMMTILTCFVVATVMMGCTSTKSPDANKQKETTTELVTTEENSLTQKNEKQNENQTTENNQLSEEKRTTSLNEPIGIKIKDIDSKAKIADIYMDEVRYYAYKTQATYEVYYMSKNKELKWNKKLKIGVTLEEGVKSQILSDICKRQALYVNASKYDVSLSAKEESKANEEAEYYLENSSEKMLSKVNISKERLVEIYKKEKIAKKVEEILNEKARHGADEMYQQWKNKVIIETKEPWNEINFSEKIME